MAINFPDSPSLGDLLVVGNRTWSYDGTFWASADVAPPQVVGAISSDSAPLNPEEGQFWWNSLDASLYVYYDSYWVQAVTGVTGAAGVAGSDGPIGVTGDTGSQGVAGADGTFASTQVIETKASAYTLVSADAGKLLLNSAAITITVQGLAVGEQVDFMQNVAGQITFAAGGGVTLNSKVGELKTEGLYSAAGIKCVAANTYILIGDLGV
jgi:hypothetical protein